MADRLQREVNTNGLAAIGTMESLNALRWGQADVLILAKAYEPEAGWSCMACGAMGANGKNPAACPECGEKKNRDANVKEEMDNVGEFLMIQSALSGKRVRGWKPALQA